MQSSHDGACATLVKVHLFDSTSGLQVQTASVEGKSFADERHFDFITVRVSSVVNNDATWLALGSLADLIEQIHAQVLKLLTTDHSSLGNQRAVTDKLVDGSLHKVWVGFATTDVSDLAGVLRSLGVGKPLSVGLRALEISALVADRVIIDSDVMLGPTRVVFSTFKVFFCSNIRFL